MITRRMSQRIRTECVAKDERHQNGASKVPLRIWAALGYGSIGLGSGGAEFFIGHHVFDSFLGPLPGDPGNAGAISVPVLACSSVCAAAASHLFSAKYPDAWVVRVLNKSVGALALGFIAAMGLMAAQSVLGNASFDAPHALFGENETPADVSLFSKILGFATPALSIGIWALALVNFWLAQVSIEKAWHEIKYIYNRRKAATRSRALMAEIEAEDKKVGELEVRREMAQRELEAPATWEFANRALGWALEGLAPIQQWLNEHKFKLRQPDTPPIPPEVLSVDIAAVEKRLAALAALDASTVHAAFNSDPNNKRATK